MITLLLLIIIGLLIVIASGKTLRFTLLEPGESVGLVIRRSIAMALYLFVVFPAFTHYGVLIGIVALVVVTFVAMLIT